MKKVLCVLLAVIFALCLSGCNPNFSWNATKAQTEGNDGRMTLIYNDGWALIYKDNETGVQYLRAGGGVTVMVNTDGTPYTGKAE